MENKDKPAFAALSRYSNMLDHFDGLTKREYFAAMAKQGFISTYSGSSFSPEPDHTAKRALAFADSLLKELEK